MSVSFTEKAVFRLRSFVRASSNEESEKGVRLAVVDGGCNGYEYSLDITSKPAADDIIYQQDGVPIYVDAKSAPLLEGISIDFVESLTHSGFQFTNPNATDACGCGKSFSAGDCTPSAVPCT